MPITSIPTNDRTERLIAASGQTVFSFDFPIYAATDLLVLRERAGVITTLTYATDYSVSGVQNQAGGNITLTSGAVLNDIIVIISNMPSGRTAQFVNGGDLPANALETEFNRTRILLQQIVRETQSALRFPQTDPNMDLLPPIAARAGRFLAFDTFGQPIAAAPAFGTVLDAISRLGDTMAGRLGFMPGSAAAPGLTPANATTTGFFGPGESEIGLAIAGNERLRMNSAGSLTVSGGFMWGGTASGTANALTLTMTPPLRQYAAGLNLRFQTGATANTGPATLNVNGLGALAINKADGTTPLAAGDLPANRIISITHDGTRWRKDAEFRVTMGEDWSHNAKYYGVVADDTGAGTPTDNTAAMSAYLQILSNTGMPGFWAGRVYCASNIVWDMGPSWERGASLSGVARQGSRLRFGGSIPANTLGLRIHSTTQPFPGYSSYDWLGLRLSQIHILANHDGFALGIGRDDLNGPLNVAVFDQCTVFNTYTGFNSGAWWLKHVVNSYFQMCAGNCYGGTAAPYYGTSLRLERVQFTHIAGGSFGNCNIGLQVQDFTNSITADAVDIEAMRVGIQTESSPVGQIRMRVPRLALAGDYCIQLLNGTTADILSIESYTTDVPAKLVNPAYGTGLLLKDKAGITAPTFAWNTNITNNTYKVVEVTILGGTPTGILVNGFDFGAAATTRMLNPGDVIRVNGSGAGTWVWRPIQQ